MSETPFNLPTPTIENAAEKERSSVSAENIASIMRQHEHLEKTADIAEFVAGLGEVPNDDQLEEKFDHVA